MSTIEQDKQLTNDKKSTLYLNFCFQNKNMLKDMLKQILMYEKNKYVVADDESSRISNFWHSVFSIFYIQRNYRPKTADPVTFQKYQHIVADTIATQFDERTISLYESTNNILNKIKQNNLTNIGIIIKSCYKMLQLSLLEFINYKTNFEHIEVLSTILKILGINNKDDLLNLIKSDFDPFTSYSRFYSQEALFNRSENNGYISKPKHDYYSAISMDNKTQLQIYKKGIYIPSKNEKDKGKGRTYTGPYHMYQTTVTNFRFFIDQFIQAALQPKQITKTYINYLVIVLNFIQFLIDNYKKMQINSGNNNIIIDIFLCFFINFMNFLSMLFRGLCLNENIGKNILNSSSNLSIQFSDFEINTIKAYNNFSEKHQLTIGTQQIIDIINMGLTNHDDVIDYQSAITNTYFFNNNNLMDLKDIENIYINEAAKSVRQLIPKKRKDTFYSCSTLINYLNNYHDTFKNDKISTYRIIDSIKYSKSLTAFIRLFNALYYSEKTGYIWIYRRFFSQNDINNIFTIETEWTKAGAGTGVNEDLKPYSIPHACKKNTDILRKLSTVYASKTNIENYIIPNLEGSDFYSDWKNSLADINKFKFDDIHKTFNSKNDCVKQIFKSARTNRFLKQWSANGEILSPLHQYTIPDSTTEVTQNFEYNTYKLEVTTNNKRIFIIEKKYQPEEKWQLFQTQLNFKEFLKNTLQSLEFKHIIYLMVNMAVAWFFEGKVVWGAGDQAGTSYEFTGHPIDCGGSIDPDKSPNFTNDEYNDGITAKIEDLKSRGELKDNPYVCLILPKLTDNMEISITNKNNNNTQKYDLNDEKMQKTIQTAMAEAFLKQQQSLTPPTKQESTSGQHLNHDRRYILPKTWYDFQGI